MPFKKNDPNINRRGRPKLGTAKELNKYLKEVAAKKGKPFLLFLVERAYESEPIAIALAKKILPDLSSQYLDGKLDNGGTKIILINPADYKSKKSNQKNERIDNQSQTLPGRLFAQPSTVSGAD